MLSICIPIYNYDVTALVQELKKQVEEHSLECEIILADDASDDVELKRKNTSIVSMCGAKFIALEKNIGRSAIRNLLALNASGDSILFLDCDTVPVRNDFLQKYYHVMNDDVVVGGIAYRDALDDQSAMLRWTYGHKRESKTADERLKMPYASFMTGNFMIKKTVFKQFTFDENITQYGHEDTLFGIQLKQHRIEIKHISNPVYHEGLEANGVFILKTKKGIENLLNLFNSSAYKTELKRQIKLLDVFIGFRDTGMIRFLAWLYKNNEKWIVKQLNKKDPNLKYFDFFKLGYMCCISLEN